jgi:histidine ammonia-lyase
MIAHCTAAALTSENKVLCHPSSSDTISTNSGTEDHVSMGGYCARKALEVISNVEYVLAIELLANCQALDFYHMIGFKSTEPLEAIFTVVREHIKMWNKDRYMAPDINSAVDLIRTNKIWTTVEKYMQKVVVDIEKSESISCLLKD